MQYEIDTARPLRVLGLPGSLRRDSINRGLLQAAAELAPDSVEVTVQDLSEVPLYNGDVEKQQVPGAVQSLAEAIRAADVVLIATPEYNAGIPGVLKNALDWLSRASVGAPLRGKAVGIVGASPGRFGTARAQEQLKLVLLALRARVFVGGSVAVSQAGGKYEGGDLVDPGTRDFVVRYLDRLEEWARDEPALVSI